MAGLIVLVLVGCGKSKTTTTNTTNTTMGDMAGYGTAGDPAKADRTIQVHITAALTYDPVALSVMPGETVTFKATNDTSGIHEFVLGDQKTQDDYEHLMSTMGNAPMTMPDRSNILDIPAGATKQLTWTFPSVTGAMVFYASHQPGDQAKGLKGVITVGGARSSAGGSTSTTMGAMTSTSMGGMTSTTMSMNDMPGMGTTTTTAGH